MFTTHNITLSTALSVLKTDRLCCDSKTTFLPKFLHSSFHHCGPSLCVLKTDRLCCDSKPTFLKIFFAPHNITVGPSLSVLKTDRLCCDSKTLFLFKIFYDTEHHFEYGTIRFKNR